MQSIENINRDLFRWWRIDNSHCVFFIRVEYIGSDEIIDIMELGNDSMRNRSSDCKTDATKAIWTLLIVDGAARLEVRGELIVDIIVEVKASECPDVWIGLRNMLHQIFEMHSQTADVVEHTEETISLNAPIFIIDRAVVSKMESVVDEFHSWRIDFAVTSW